jgi:nitroimidazol reductase NimA-like FMN-containing flavoprotein (pyridoxamine 5'-phosphate oxidase superfamily)
VPTEILDRGECERLLASQEIGRLAVVVDRYPMVFPVSFALDNGTIVFRSGAGTKLTAAHHQNVGFQVDEVDLGARTAWSVLVTGMAETVGDDHDATLVERSRALAIDPLEPGSKDRWVRIIPASISGRRISGEASLTPLWDSAAYL